MGTECSYGYCILIQVLYTFYIVSANFLTCSLFSAKLPKKEKRKRKERRKEALPHNLSMSCRMLPISGKNHWLRCLISGEAGGGGGFRS